MFSLDEKVAVVTGGASGIGRGIVEALCREGAKVVVGDVDERELATLADALGDGIETVVCDIGDSAQAAGLIAAARERFGRLDALVNNAGIEGNGSVETCPEEVWERVMRVNLNGAFFCSKHAVPALRDSGGGAIVHTASVAGFWGEPGTAAYNASKGALLGLTRAMAMDHANDGIRVNAVCPGYHSTGMPFRYFEAQEDPAQMRSEAAELIALRRFGKPEEIGNLYAFLISDANPYITGATIVADGGMTAGFPWHSGS